MPPERTEQVSDRKPFFIQGRRCPDDKFRTSVVWRLRAMALNDDPAFVQQLDLADARLFSVTERTAYLRPDSPLSSSSGGSKPTSTTSNPLCRSLSAYPV
jgi:hypothetical protein